MEIVLLERVEKLGQMGQVVNVRPGYARNYLLPQKKALRATKANLAFFETQKAQLQARNLERKKEAEEVAGKMKGLAVIITRQAAESGMLYGSVNGRDISDTVTAEGFTIERNQVAINDPIKSLGLFDVRVILHPEVSVNVKGLAPNTPYGSHLHDKACSDAFGGPHYMNDPAGSPTPPTG